MARFNEPTVKEARVTGPDTHNRAGGQAYAQEDKVKLAGILLTSFVQDQYYRSANDTLSELGELVQAHPEFAAKAAVYARNEFGMRSISHVVAGTIPSFVKGESWTKNFIEKVIRRPDDATEIVSFYLGNYGKPLPNSLKRGIAKALGKFDAYQLAKYRNEGKQVSLVDIVNLVHPRPNEKNGTALELLVDGKLRSTGTWESDVSAAGSDKEAKEKAWSDLLRERKIGYFALLRNLRNIESLEDKELIKIAADLLVDEKLIKNSLVLPFRFSTALDHVSDQKLVSAINKALDISTANVPELPGKSLIAVDHSGSMGYGEDRSDPRAKANLFAAVLAKANDADVIVFGSGAKYVKGLNKDDSTLSIEKDIERVECGHSTDFNAVFEVANKDYERVITLSDMQSWDRYHGPEAEANAYARKYRGGKLPHYYNIDLQGYGTRLFPEKQVYELAGYSEKVFDIMALLETDRKALINTIEAIEL